MLKKFALPDYWQKPLWSLLVLLSAFVLIFWNSWGSIVSIWMRSDTFAHGYLVAPASVWLIWLKKDTYKQLKPVPGYMGLIFLLGCGFLWLAASLSKVLVVEQFALVGILIGIVWVILGGLVTSSMQFPLLFLFLMVPFGEDFVPFLIDFTTNFLVKMLRLTGVTVYQEGNYLTLTTGQWSVVEACSGIRYLIASITLGLVYAYLNYSSYLKRAIFILISMLLPILANGLRAYMIVMIGHLSSMKLATGVDHIIYGWIFFGLVMLMLFYAGSFWQDPPVTVSDQSVQEDTAAAATTTHFMSATLITLACIAFWPFVAWELNAQQPVKALIPADLIQQLPTETHRSPDWGWQPQFKGVMAESQRFIEVDENTVAVYFANFGDESQGGELINSQNILLQPKQSQWRLIQHHNIPVAWMEQADVEEAVLKSDLREILVLRWYRIGNRNTVNRYYAKWLQLLKRLSADASPELMVVLYTQTSSGQYEQARDSLKKVARMCCG